MLDKVKRCYDCRLGVLSSNGVMKGGVSSAGVEWLEPFQRLG